MKASSAALASVRSAPDQLFNSIITATDLASAKNPKLRKRTVAKARFRTLREFLVIFEDDEGGASEGFSGNVPQGLLMLNGTLTNLGTRGGKGTLLHQARARESKNEQIRTLFLAAYSRPPTKAELENLAGLDNRSVTAQDLFHALLTSTEFVTNH